MGGVVYTAAVYTRVVRGYSIDTKSKFYDTLNRVCTSTRAGHPAAVVVCIRL